MVIEIHAHRHDRGRRVIPLHIQTNIWAVRRGLDVHLPRNDELTRAQDLRPAAR
jgi:hypothetical protein